MVSIPVVELMLHAAMSFTAGWSTYRNAPDGCTAMLEPSLLMGDRKGDPAIGMSAPLAESIANTDVVVSVVLPLA